MLLLAAQDSDLAIMLTSPNCDSTGKPTGIIISDPGSSSQRKSKESAARRAAGWLCPWFRRRPVAPAPWHPASASRSVRSCEGKTCAYAHAAFDAVTHTRKQVASPSSSARRRCARSWHPIALTVTPIRTRRSMLPLCGSHGTPRTRNASCIPMQAPHRCASIDSGPAEANHEHGEVG